MKKQNKNTIPTALLVCIIAVFVSFLSSCKKEEWNGITKLNGQVLNSKNDQPVPNATVRLYVRRDNANNFQVIKETKADTNGKYNLEFKSESEELYKLDA